MVLGYFDPVIDVIHSKIFFFRGHLTGVSAETKHCTRLVSAES